MTKRKSKSAEEVDTGVAEISRDADEGEGYLWTLFERYQDPDRVAEEAGVDVRRVCQVLNSDPERYRDSVALARQRNVRAWRRHEERTHRIIAGFTELIEAQLHEIQEAAANGRLTKLLTKDGRPMPALDAIQMIAAGRLFGQVIRLGTQASRLVWESERIEQRNRPAQTTAGEVDSDRPDLETPAGGTIASELDRFDSMSWEEIEAEFIRVGLDPPTIHRPPDLPDLPDQVPPPKPPTH